MPFGWKWGPKFQKGGSGQIQQGMGIPSTVTAWPWAWPSAKRHWIPDNEPINHPIKLLYHGPASVRGILFFLIIQ